MDNELIYHYIIDTGYTLLAKSFLRPTFEINGTIVTLREDGYYTSGKPLDSTIEFYKDSNGYYYVVRNTSSSTAAYITINTLAVERTGSPLINEYTTSFDVSNLTKLTQLNENTHVWSTGRISNSAGNTYEYTSKLGYRQYNAETSLILISLRNSDGIGGSACYLMHRLNTNSKATFSLEPLYAFSNISQFNVTPTNNGFTVTNTKGYHVNITEIAQAF